jgi:hypothetical protein
MWEIFYEIHEQKYQTIASLFTFYRYLKNPEGKSQFQFMA